jgi:hypothetical protein
MTLNKRGAALEELGYEIDYHLCHDDSLTWIVVTPGFHDSGDLPSISAAIEWAEKYEKSGAGKEERRKAYACEVCGSEPGSDGVILHSKSCHVVCDDGAGLSYVDLNKMPNWEDNRVRVLANKIKTLEAALITCNR